METNNLFSTATKLITKAINFHHEENREAHRTDDYEVQELIIRRGQTFDITVTFNREYNPQDDIVIVQFVTGIQTKLVDLVNFQNNIFSGVRLGIAL